MRFLTAVLLASAIVITGCGDDDDNPLVGGTPYIEAELIEAQEQNNFELGDIRYQVVMFRQINPRVAPDRALYEGTVPDDVGIYAAFIRACNAAAGDDPTTPTSRIQLEDAFGDTYPQVDDAPPEPFAYNPRPLEPDNCIPRPNSAAARTFPGAALLFRIPFDEVDKRPFVLQFEAPDAEGAKVARVELSL